MFSEITRYKFFDSLTELPFVQEIWLFGSRARNDNQSRADIDIAVLCPEASRNDWLKIMDIIDDADTLLSIDCIRFDELDKDSDLANNILKDKVKLYERTAK